MKVDLEYVDNNATQMNTEERTQLIRLFHDFDNLFDGTIGDWDTHPVDLELNPDYKPFNCKIYHFSRINKETFHK